MMNKFTIGAAALLMLTSCYEDYVMDYEVQGVGFANQTDVRSLIVGEGMSFSTGVALGGTISNDEDRIVSYETDYSLVSQETLDAMKAHRFSYIQTLTASISGLEALPAAQYSLHRYYRCDRGFGSLSLRCVQNDTQVCHSDQDH